MNPAETIATVLGIACVALAAVRSVWTFPAAIGSVTLLGIVVWDARLYSDALLQGFFVLANLYGWRNWTRAATRVGEVPVERMTARSRVRWAAVVTMVTLGWGGAMHAWTDASWPWWDAAIAAASVAAQLLMARRKLENWLLWVAIDLASVPLYLVKGLPMLALLYLVYLALALWGWLGWLAAERGVVRTAVAA